MAEGALNTHGTGAAFIVKKAGNSHHCVELEQGERGCRIVEIDLAGFELLFQPVGQGVYIDLKADGERSFS